MNAFMYCALPAALLVGAAAADEVVFEEAFTYHPSATPPFQQIYGDVPEAIEANGIASGVGSRGQAAARLKLRFAADKAKKDKGLSYWAFTLPEPLPLVDGLQQAQVTLRTNAPVSLKLGLDPFGFIYHSAATATPAAAVQMLAQDKLAAELQGWCRKGDKDPRQGSLGRLILAIATPQVTDVEIVIERLAVTAADGTRSTINSERLRRRAAAVKIATVSLLWSDKERTVPKVLEAMAIAAQLGADVVALPQECVATVGEPIPGPITRAIAEQAKALRVNVVGNLREVADGRTYVTSFWLNREGALLGKYRKSHKLPDEDMALGEALPVLNTDVGKVAMKIGTDRHFPEIDHCYAAQGAQMLFWAQMPEPVEDEHLQDRPVPGMAYDYRMTYVCSRYASAQPGYITNFLPTYLGRPIGRSYVVNPEGVRVASTGRVGGGVALATVPVSQVGGGRAPTRIAGFKLLCDDQPMRPKPAYAKRQIRVAAIDSHLDIAKLEARLDELGRFGCDIVCTYEFVWIAGGPAEQVAAQTAQAKKNLARVAAKARQHRMYVLVAGVIDRLERNEAILYDREGQEVWRYFKIVQTHPEQICGDQVPVHDTDFGRLGAYICADEAHLEVPRCLMVQGADLLFFPTQSWGSDATMRVDRDLSRAMNGGLFLVEATCPSSEPMHNSHIYSPSGAILAQSPYNAEGYCLATIDLDQQRPKRHAREWTPHTPGGYLPEYQPDRKPKEYNDLFDTIRRQRRPALYRPFLQR